MGGGVRSLQDIRDLLNAGADKVSIMTAAIKNPDLVDEAAAKIGSANLVVAIDAKQVSGEGESPRWEVFTHGGRNETGIDAVEWAAQVAERGAGEILLTSMDRDGTKSGYDLAMLRQRRRGQRRGSCDRPRRWPGRRPLPGGPRGVDFPFQRDDGRRGEGGAAGGRNPCQTSRGDFGLRSLLPAGKLSGADPSARVCAFRATDSRGAGTARKDHGDGASARSTRKIRAI